MLWRQPLHVCCRLGGPCGVGKFACLDLICREDRHARGALHETVVLLRFFRFDQIDEGELWRWDAKSGGWRRMRQWHEKRWCSTARAVAAAGTVRARNDRLMTCLGLPEPALVANLCFCNAIDHVGQL